MAVQPALASAETALASWLRAAPLALAFGLRLWVAVCLALFVAFWLELEHSSWAGTSAAFVCQPVLGGSLRKGWFRLIGTLIGAIAAVVLSACFPQSRAGLLLALAFWGGVCAFMATLLRNFASYAAALAGFTAAIIIGDELGAVGGANGDAFNLAVARTTEIWVGIVCAGLVLATTDLGGTRRRLATLLNGLTAEISGGLMQALRVTGPAQALSRPVRGQLLVRVSGLDVVIDQAAGEIATLPFRPRALQAATEGLVIALLAWRSVANHMESAPQARAEANQVMRCLVPLLPVLERADDPALWAANPGAMRATLFSAARLLVAIRTEEPSLRLLADRMAEGLLGLSRAITGALVLERPRLALVARRVARLRVPDVLPALMNAVRAFVAIGVASLVWIWLAWPGGATFITFTVIGVTMFAPREREAYAAARSFTVGICLTAVCAGVIGFALLPQISSFAGLCAALGLVLVPAGALSTQPWQQPVFFALGTMFAPLLSPSNPMTYDPGQYYNSATALIGGLGFAMLAFRLLPPMAPTARTRRLLALTLRDLRRLSRGRPWVATEWAQRVYGRISALPSSVDTLQAARMAAALSLGRELIRLRQLAGRFALRAGLERAMVAIGAGNSEAAIREFDDLDRALAAISAEKPGARVRLRARGAIRSAAHTVKQYASYFDANVPG